MNLAEIEPTQEIMNDKHYELRAKFNEDAESMGCHCPIEGCGDSQCGIVGLENYLDQAYWLGYEDGKRDHKTQREDPSQDA